MREGETIEGQLREVNYVRDKQNKNLREYKEASKNRERIFGQDMPAILSIINRNKQSFQRVPVGPIGLRLSLEKDQWAHAVEVVIGGSLSAFIVHSHRDERTLKNLLKNSRVRKCVFSLNCFFRGSFGCGCGCLEVSVLLIFFLLSSFSFL